MLFKKYMSILEKMNLCEQIEFIVEQLRKNGFKEATKSSRNGTSTTYYYRYDCGIVFAATVRGLSGEYIYVVLDKIIFDNWVKDFNRVITIKDKKVKDLSNNDIKNRDAKRGSSRTYCITGNSLRNYALHCLTMDVLGGRQNKGVDHIGANLRVNISILFVCKTYYFLYFSF